MPTKSAVFCSLIVLAFGVKVHCDSSSELLSGIENDSKSAINNLTSLNGTVQNEVNELLSTVNSTVQSVVDNLIDELDKILDGAHGKNVTQCDATGTLNTILGLAEPTVNQVFVCVNNIVNKVDGLLNDALNNVNKILKNALDLVGNIVSCGLLNLLCVLKITASLGGLPNDISKTLTDALNDVGKLLDTVPNCLSTNLDLLQKAGTNLLNNLTECIDDL